MFLENTLLENVGSFESHHTAGKNWNLLARFRITANALVLVANLKCRERRQFHGFTIDDSVTDFIEDHLDKSRRLRSGKAYLPVNSLCQISSRDRFTSHDRTCLVSV